MECRLEKSWSIYSRFCQLIDIVTFTNLCMHVCMFYKLNRLITLLKAISADMIDTRFSCYHGHYRNVVDMHKKESIFRFWIFVCDARLIINRLWQQCFGL